MTQIKINKAILKASAKDHKKNPVVVEAIKQACRDGIDRIPQEWAEQATVAVSLAQPTWCVSSICLAFGYPELTESTSQRVESALEEKASAVLSDINPAQSESKSEDDEFDDIDDTSEEAPEFAHDPAGTPQELYNTFCSFEKRASYQAYGPSDSQLASIAKEVFGRSQCRRVSLEEQWLSWTGAYWKECDAGVIRRNLRWLADMVKRDLKNVRGAIADKDRGAAWAYGVLQNRYEFPKGSHVDFEEMLDVELKKMTAMVKKLQSVAGQQSVARCLGDDLLVDREELDNNTDELVFSNVAWNAVTNEFYPPRQKSLATMGCDFSWEEPSSEAVKRWDDLLAKFGMDKETIEFLQCSFGYSALGRGSLKRYWWFRGATNTGKTTLINFVGDCLGGYTHQTDTKQWVVKTMNASGGHNDEVAALAGKRFVLAEEFRPKDRLDDGAIKQSTGSDIKVYASRKGKSGRSFKVRYGLWFSSNFDAQIDVGDEALINRLTCLTFTKTVGKVNTKFREIYLSDVDNKRAIMKWVMDGALKFIANGDSLPEEPQAVIDARLLYVEDQASLEDHIHQVVRVTRCKTDSVSVSELKESLIDLQRRTREYVHFTGVAISKVVLKMLEVPTRKEAEEKGFYKKGNGVVRYYGIKLEAPQDDDAPLYKGANLTVGQAKALDSQVDEMVDSGYVPRGPRGQA